MKLNRDDISNFRKFLREELKSITIDNERIKLDKNLLEQLIFVRTGYNSKKIVWSGEFLRKLDLSELSFDDVNWCSPYRVDLSYTNIIVDFKKSNNKVLKNISLEGVDLSKSNLDVFDNIYDCNLKNTSASLYFNDENIKYISDCDLTGIDLSKSEISFFTYEKYFLSSCFKNTGINIKLNKKISDKTKNLLADNIKKGFFENCYINGIKIKSSEEKFLIKQKMKDKYEKMKEEQKESLIKVLAKYKTKV